MSWLYLKPDKSYLDKYDWKHYSGDFFGGDVLNFKYYHLKKDTLYKGEKPIAIVVSIGLSKVTIQSLDKKQTVTYTNKRFD